MMKLNQTLQLISKITLIFVLVSSCQHKPTKVIESSNNTVNEETVLLDTRSPFEFESFHVEGSQNLWSADFLILNDVGLSRANFLKDKIKKQRTLDRQLDNVIERLRKKGISPQRKVVLLGSDIQSVENLKWKWLLSQFEIRNIELNSVKHFLEQHKNLPNKFKESDWGMSWVPEILKSESLQKKLFKDAKTCFESSSLDLCK